MSQQLPPDFSPWEAQPPVPTPRKHRRTGLRTLICFLALLCLAGFLINNNLLRIRNIAVIGNYNVSWEEVVQAAGLTGGPGYFSISEDAVRAGINANRYLIYDGMEKHFPDSLTLYVIERSPCARVQVMGVTYLLDAEGLVLERVKGLTPEEKEAQRAAGIVPVEQAYLFVTGLQAREVRVGNCIVPGTAAQLEAYRKLLEEIYLQGFSHQVSELNLSDPDSLYLVTVDGYTAHLGDAQQLRAKLGTLRAVVAKLQEMGRQGGVIEVSTPPVATYTPAEL